jgi:hypothetical protein
VQVDGQKANVTCEAGRVCSPQFSKPSGAAAAVNTPGATDGAARAPWVISGLVGMGLGGAGILVGSIFGGLAIGKKNDAYCTDPGCTADAQRPGNRESALSFATVSTVAFITGGILAASGFVLYLLAPKSPEKLGRVRDPLVIRF